jgi:hypothetical protein
MPNKNTIIRKNQSAANKKTGFLMFLLSLFGSAVKICGYWLVLFVKMDYTMKGRRLSPMDR